jgi:hypothetical protein
VEIAVDLMSIQSGAQNAYALKEEVEEVVELQHLLELHLAAAAIRVGLLMGIVIMSTTILIAPRMVEIAVDLMSIYNSAHNDEEGKARIQQHHLKNDRNKKT